MLLTDGIQNFFIAFAALYAAIMFGGGGLITLFFQDKFLKKDYSFEPQVSVLLSAYNEGQAIYQTIQSLSEVDYPKDKLEIIVFDDCSKDDTFYWIEKAALDFPNVVAHKNETNAGKTANQIKAAKMSKGEILLGVDSDCIFNKDAVRELVVCFTHEKIAAVGGRVGIKNIEDSYLTKMQNIHYYLNFLSFKQFENIFGAIQCLSGPLVAIKKDKYFEILPEIENRHFLGQSVKFGEDRAITQFLLRKGYQTKLNVNSVCWTECPKDIQSYLKQQLRWKKSSLSLFLDLLLNSFTTLKNHSFICCVLGLTPIFLLLFSLVGIFKLFLTQDFIQKMSMAVFITICIYFIRYAFYNLLTKNFLKSDAIKESKSLFLTSIFSTFWFALNNLVLTTLAVGTLDDTGWGTRQISQPSKKDKI